MTVPGFEPPPCIPGGGAADVESLLLCDIVAGEVVGTAIAVYEYDQDGNPTGPPTFVVPGTNNPYVVQGSLQPCPTEQVDTEILVLCDSNGTKFLRRYVYDAETPGSPTITNTTLDGSTAFAPVGAVTSCDDPCCPTVIGQGCTDVGSGFYTALLLPDGSVDLIDSVTADPVAAGDIIPCPPENGALPATVAADHFDVVPGSSWTVADIPVGRRLVGLAYTVLTGTVQVTDATGGTLITAIPAGYSASWNVQDDRETLTPPSSIVADAASRAIVTMVTAL